MAESKSLANPLPELNVTRDRDFDEREGPTQQGEDLAFGGVPIPTPSPDIPERVRFAVPAVLSFDGYEETFDVAILNLSANGVACTGPQGLAVRDRLRLSFRLNLTSHPRSFLCEVIWVQATSNDEANYGLRFVDLDADLADHVLDTVRERVEGRASEWAMPILPGPSDEELRAESKAASLGATAEPSAKRSWRHIWLAASAGMAAGIGLCLVIAAVTASMQDVAVVSPPQAAAPVPGPPTMPLQPVAPTAPEARPDAKTESAKVAPPAQTPPAPKAEAAPAQEEPAPESSKPALVLSSPAGVQLEVHSGGRASLMLPLNGPPTQKEMFWLNNPTRLVVDVAGRQSALTRGVYDLDSPIVSRVRVGHHPGKVRFVIETGKSVATKATAQAQGNRLRLELQSSR